MVRRRHRRLDIAAVMELYPVGERFFQDFTLRQVLLNAAKNGCMDASRAASEFFDRPAWAGQLLQCIRPLMRPRGRWPR